jgi:hypothetical protein
MLPVRSAEKFVAQRPQFLLVDEERNIRLVAQKQRTRARTRAINHS